MTAPASPRRAPEGQRIPLEDVVITFPRHNIFTTKKETVTFEGKDLATALRWIALMSPYVSNFGRAEPVGFELAGIAHAVRAIGDADLDSIPTDLNAVFCSLADRLHDLAARINAGAAYEGVSPMLTIRRKPAAGDASTKKKAVEGVRTRGLT